MDGHEVNAVLLGQLPGQALSLDLGRGVGVCVDGGRGVPVLQRQAQSGVLSLAPAAPTSAAGTSSVMYLPFLGDLVGPESSMAAHGCCISKALGLCSSRQAWALTIDRARVDQAPDTLHLG